MTAQPTPDVLARATAAMPPGGWLECRGAHVLVWDPSPVSVPLHADRPAGPVLTVAGPRVVGVYGPDDEVLARCWAKAAEFYASATPAPAPTPQRGETTDARQRDLAKPVVRPGATPMQPMVVAAPDAGPLFGGLAR